MFFLKMSLGIGQHPYQLLHSGRSSFLDVSEGTGTVPDRGAVCRRSVALTGAG